MGVDVTGVTKGKFFKKIRLEDGFSGAEGL
jgi:hypothetical protein